ncbi:MAG: TIGR01777 family protein [bacterium]|nr:TIGR01777 family protein [bacterium]
MRVLITGGTGLIGTGLQSALISEGHSVVVLTRRPSISGQDSIQWNPESGSLNVRQLEGFDAVVHLAGEGIGDGRWTSARKARIVNSRVVSTRLLSEAIAGLETPPKVLIASSAIGYYGDRGDEMLTEDSDPGSGFLSELCVDWEKAVSPVADRGVRVVNTRIGVVLARNGGALGQMLPIYRLGLGGRLGSGRQFWSWIGFDDLIGGMMFALGNAALSGPVNLVSPHPVRNAEFSDTLARAVHRPAIFPAPAFALRLLLAEMADALLLASMRVAPTRLQGAGYQFKQSSLDSALQALLSR